MRSVSREEAAQIAVHRFRASRAAARMSDAELEGCLIAFLRERSKRDGLTAASAWCMHWGDKLMLAAGREGDS
ncbi:hypothetical protein [Albidovulum sediminis]|uniref:Uncharacterized protein n=1 Tax=Albidovulum sediminis TaxID=3066345 RepID=A0ABT2NH82_9RHOB|nr:hypothetical protein [Defluviimonas sediminis]MCT8328267.1 hypothetical protein [Defluviimonas sediminis]